MIVDEDTVKSRLYPEAAELLAGIGREIANRSDSEVRETLKGVLAVVQETMASDNNHGFACIEKLLAKLEYNTVP